MKETVKILSITVWNCIIPVQLLQIRFCIRNICHWSKNKVTIFMIINLQWTENNTIIRSTVWNPFFRIQKILYIFHRRMGQFPLLRHTKGAFFSRKKIHWNVRIKIVHFNEVYQIICVFHKNLPYHAFIWSIVMNFFI